MAAIYFSVTYKDKIRCFDILVRDGFETERLVCRFKLTFNGE